MNSQTISDPKQKAVHEFMVKAFAAWESLTPTSVDSFFRKAPQDRYFHLYSTSYHHWEDYKAHLENFMNTHISLKINITDARVFQEGEVVYTAFSYEIDEELKDRTQSTREGRYTGVLLQDDDSWQIVHEQWSLPVRAAGWENY